MEWMNCTMKDCLWSEVASPRAIATCMERRKTLGSYPDSDPTWHQAAAVIICQGGAAPWYVAGHHPRVYGRQVLGGCNRRRNQGGSHLEVPVGIQGAGVGIGGIYLCGPTH